MIELDAYAVDCRVHGQVEFGEGRLSDQLNRTLRTATWSPCPNSPWGMRRSARWSRAGREARRHVG
jgi:hypothetical protein